MGFFAELKRRNVIKVTLAYLIVSWLLLQISDTLVPALRLPEWFHSGVAFVLILGFPLALIFAWAFEMTPEGLKKEKEIDRSESIAKITGQKLNYTIIGLLVLALGYFIWESRFDDNDVNPGQDRLAELQPGTQTPSATAESNVSAETFDQSAPDRKSIAVIPFRNRSANEENAEFFSDGVHDELLTNLAKIEALKVISRTSVMSYRGTTKNLRQIGEELGVAIILEGGVQRAGDTVRINVQLIDAATDEHLWAKVYDRQLTAENIFAIQSEIAREIATALEATLSPREQERLAIAPTTNLEAYDNLLLARQLTERGNWQDLRDAQAYLRNAIELDPAFIEAYILLANTYFYLSSTGAATLSEVNEPWESTIQAALALDSDNADAQAGNALYLWGSGRNGAESAFEKARQLEPANAEIMAMYAGYLRSTFRFDRALPLYESARELDPVSIRVLSGLARIRMARHELDEALALYARIRQIDPANITGYGYVSDIYIIKGNMVQALNWVFKALVIDPDDSDLYNWVALMYMDLGDYASARKWLVWIERSLNANPLTVSGIAMLDILEGNFDASATNVRRAFEESLVDRLGSDSVLVRALLIWALGQDQTSSALKIVTRAHPELFDHAPVVNAGNILQAVDSAHLLRQENRGDEARKLLLAVVAAYDEPYAETDAWLAPGRAQALALLGNKQAALKELRHRVDSGWRLFWRWSTELNPNFESLRNDPEFRNIVEFLRADMARQLEELRAMEASGEIPMPPPASD